MAIAGGYSLENTGSLTGHILSQGRNDIPTSKSSMAKVMVILLAGLTVVAAVGLFIAMAIGDGLSALFEGLIS